MLFTLHVSPLLHNMVAGNTHKMCDIQAEVQLQC